MENEGQITPFWMGFPVNGDVYAGKLASWGKKSSDFYHFPNSVVYNLPRPPAYKIL